MRTCSSKDAQHLIQPEAMQSRRSCFGVVGICRACVSASCFIKCS